MHLKTFFWEILVIFLGFNVLDCGGSWYVEIPFGFGLIYQLMGDKVEEIKYRWQTICFKKHGKTHSAYRCFIT